MIELKDISKTYSTGRGPLTVLDGATASIAPGTFTVVCGPSGCGKSTLLLILGGLLHPDRGSVSVHGDAIFDLSAERRALWRAQSVGYVFQRFHLLPYLSVKDNIRSAAVALKGARDDGRVDELMERFGMMERASHRPAELSAGERQRTALARALYNRPGVLLADEPTGNLDPDNAETVLKAFTEFAAGGGTVLMVTHDPDAADRADTCWSMRGGQLTVESTKNRA
jgi:ABC-type lipoprotein export system ATPase subunit